MPQDFFKQPAENKDYDFDFTDWLPTGDTITSAAVTADSGVTLGTKTVSTTAVKQWISGGTDGSNYKIVATITTAQGRIDQEEIWIHVRDL